MIRTDLVKVCVPVWDFIGEEVERYWLACEYTLPYIAGFTVFFKSFIVFSVVDFYKLLSVSVAVCFFSNRPVPKFRFYILCPIIPLLE